VQECQGEAIEDMREVMQKRYYNEIALNKIMERQVALRELLTDMKKHQEISRRLIF
jgi:hypothetical protein